ncbi:MAG: glycoside hydrolase family 97 protein [Cytophagales bacterium]|nr:MAG: glycoside hydrolase family 97 protein [Cytophagales bacterium]
MRKVFNKVLLLISFFVILSSCQDNKKEATKELKVYTPDSTMFFSLYEKNTQIYYSVVRNQDTIIKESLLGITRADQDFTEGLSFVSAIPVKKIEEAYTMYIGKRKENKNIGNELIASFKNKAGAIVQIGVRAYNDGVAFRYQFPDGTDSITIKSEATSFAIPTDGKAWLQLYGKPTDWGPAYENDYSNGSQIGISAQDTFGWSFPALFKSNSHWLMITEANLNEQYFASHLQSNCDGGIYKLRLPEQGEGKGVYNNIAKTKLPFNTPWRLIMVGETIAPIVESNLVYDLSEANKIGDASWVKPGRSSWNWWGEHDGSKKFSSLKNFVNLSKEFSWEYSLVDANWDLMEDGGKIEDLVKYANSQQIGLSLWYNSGGIHNVVTERPRDIMSDPVKRKEEFKKLRAWGVKAVKIDFFQSDKQEIIKLYLDILKDAAAEQIMVVFHGCTLPRGWSRTYPNLVSMEAIKGAEQYGWDSAFAIAAPAHNTIVCFTRNVVGPMDYTPVTFGSYEKAPHTTSNAHELALAVLFESGILHFADRAPSYRALAKPVKDYMKIVPVTWDDTKFIDGEPGKLVVLARQKGEDWFIAGANGEKLNKELNINLPFLKSGAQYKMLLLKDGANASEIKTEELTYSSGNPINIKMIENGGFTIWLKKI